MLSVVCATESAFLYNFILGDLFLMPCYYASNFGHDENQHNFLAQTASINLFIDPYFF